MDPLVGGETTSWLLILLPFVLRCELPTDSSRAIADWKLVGRRADKSKADERERERIYRQQSGK
jgi:hypothetical protein